MGIIADAIDDAADFLSNEDDFGVPILLKSPDGEEANVIGYSRKIHKRLDQNTGMIVNSKNASVTVREKTIQAANAQYPVRNADAAGVHHGEVNMIGHRVDVADSTGITKNYVVIEQEPNETVGSIVLILGDFRE